MVLFSNFGKKVTDLFKRKDHEFHPTFKLKFSDGKAEVSTETSFVPNSGDIIKTKYKHKYNSFGALEIELPNTKPMKVDYEMPCLIEGLKLNLVSEKPRAGLKAKYELGGVAAKVTAETSVDDVSNARLSAELTKEAKGLWYGGKIDYNTSTGLEGYSGGIYYQRFGTQFILTSSPDELKVQLHKRFSSSGEVAADYEVDFKNPRTPLVSFGGKYIFDESTTAQGFVQSTGKAYMLYKHKMFDHCTVHLASTIDMKEVTKGANLHYKFEFEV